MVNKVYINPETSWTWSDATTGGDGVADLGSLAADGVVMGSYQDLGSGARADMYEFELLVDGFDTSPVVGETVALYWSQSNSTTNFTGNPTADPTSTVAGTATAGQAKNMLLAGIASVYSTTAANELKITGVIRLTSRYASPVVHNDTSDALLGTSDSHTITLTPIPQEIQ